MYVVRKASAIVFYLYHAICNLLVSALKKKNVYIKLAEAVSMRCEEKLRGRSEYPITNTDMVHSP
jgi:hypothetical protein